MCTVFGLRIIKFGINIPILVLTGACTALCARSHKDACHGSKGQHQKSAFFHIDVGRLYTIAHVGFLVSWPEDITKIYTKKAEPPICDPIFCVWAWPPNNIK